MNLPLSDIRVVEICQLAAGPFTGTLLADHGANVIKVEPPEGDRGRRMGALSNTNQSLGFLTYNRNKRSIVLDLHQPEGRDLVRALLRRADVLVMNTRLSGRQRAGLTYEDVSAINPGIVYASITGYGEEGPDADLPGIDIVVQARVGDLAARRLPDGPLPPHTSLFHYDVTAAVLTFGAVVLALRERDRSGRGKKIEVNILHTAMLCQALQMTQVEGREERFPVLPRGLPSTYRCRDGRYILDTTINIGPRWEDLCYDLGLYDLANDPRFDTMEKREQYVSEITEILSRLFLTKRANEWEAVLKAHGHVTSIVKEIREVSSDPQVVANGMMTEYQQPGLGMVTTVNSPAKMSGLGSETWFRRPPAALGEHTNEVLQEFGFSLEAIQALRAKGVVG